MSSREPHSKTPDYRDLQNYHNPGVPAHPLEPPQATGPLASKARAPDPIEQLQNHPAQIAVADLAKKVVLTTLREAVAVHMLQRSKLWLITRFKPNRQTFAADKVSPHYLKGP